VRDDTPKKRDFPVPPNEAERLRALEELGVWGVGPNEQIDRICVLARDLFKVPVARVNLVGEDKVVRLSRCAPGWAEIDRRHAISNMAILGDRPLVLTDVAADPRFNDNPYVCGPPYIRFFAGAPLRLRPGINIGSLSIMDFAPRSFGAEDRAHLSALAEMIVSEMRGQRTARVLVDTEKRMKHTAKLVQIAGWQLDIPSQTMTWDDEIYRIYGIPPGTPPSYDLILSRYDPAMRGKSRRRVNALVIGGVPCDTELRGTRPNGEIFWVRAIGEAEMKDGKVTRVLGAVQNITERKIAEARIHELAYRDSLTGLPNRVSFIDRLHKSVAAAARTDAPLVLINFNVDHFREMNDALGHQAADALLHHVAQDLWRTFGAHGTVARIGGDEFAVIVRGRKAVVRAASLAQDFMARIAGVNRQDSTLPLSLSAGLAIFPEHGEDGETVMKNAKVALLEAKAQDRGSLRVYDPDLRKAIDETTALVRRIWTGIANGEFVLFYQPIVSARDGKVSGLEALMRWRDPELGVLAPARFMIGFEQPELALALGDLALDQALAQARAWLGAGIEFGSIAVNLTTSQFRRGNLADSVLAKLERAGVPAQRLTLEVTENVYMAWGADVVAETIRKLHEAGVGIALDDFGTGYASLTHLRQFPIDKLKIDKSFVQSPESGAIVDAVINMGMSLGLQVVAEGVEKPEQLSLLRMKGCDYVQGFLFAQPLEAERIPDFIEAFNRPQVEADQQMANG
jgi:diguanylate cyclase (GGDEF)-like protein